MTTPRSHLPRLHHAVVLACLALSTSGHAEIYKFVDDNGHVTYTNMPRPGAKKLELGPLPATPAGKASTLDGKTDKKRSTAGTSTPGNFPRVDPGNFPRVDPGTQRKRDDMRRQLLVEELASEQRNHAAAQSAFINGRRQPGADLNRLMDAVRLHEKNIEMLNKELSHIR